MWEKKNGGFVPSAPKPFTSMPLVMANAFGGKDEWDELPVPFASNPEGKGFRVFEENVTGTPLPNIESPDRLLTVWNETPEPAGCSAPPPAYAVKVARFIEFDMQTGMMKKIDPKFYNTCFPDMIVPELLEAGSQVRVEGVRRNGPLAFALPKCPVRAHIRFHEDDRTMEPWVDQIGIDVEASRVFVTYRLPFRYTIETFVKRITELLPSEPAFAAAEPEPEPSPEPGPEMMPAPVVA